MSRAIVFGATGMIGSAIVGRLAAEGCEIVAVSRRGGEVPGATALAFDPLAPSADWGRLGGAPFDRIVFAQGMNRTDGLHDFDRAAFAAVLDANVTYVAVAIAALVAKNRLARPARFAVVSSVWQTIARQDKLSYMVSKAALEGLVLSASADLARDGHLINAVLPGVLDTAMTRAMLSPEQIARIEAATLFGRLPDVQDVAETVSFLCSDRNNAVTGQSVAVDLGFRHVRLV